MYINFNRRGVRVGIGLIGGACLSLPLLRCSTVRASAANLEPYTLSPQQTLALYGTSIDVDVYSGSSVVTYQASYIGSTLDIQAGTYLATYGDSMYLSRFEMVDVMYLWMTEARMKATPYLIYRFNPPNFADASNFDFSVRLVQSLGITAYGFGTTVLWSYNQSPGMVSPNADHPYYSSSYTLYGNGLQDVLTVGTSLRYRGMTDYYGSVSTQLLPVKITNDVNHTLGDYEYLCSQDACVSMLGCVAFAGSTESGSDAVTVGNSICYIKQNAKVTPYDTFDYSTNSYSNSKVNSQESPDTGMYIMVQCPTLYGEYILPDSGGDEGVDLSTIEGYLEQQSSDISNISEEATVQTRQLIAILAKLEQIYQKIPSVDLSVPALSTAPSIPIDSDVDSRINDDLSSGAELLPDISETFDNEKMQSFSDLLTRVRGWIPVEMISIGAVTLALAFVSWLLFRGRGS